MHVSTQTSAHAAAVLDLHLLSNQGRIPFLAGGKRRLRFDCYSGVTHALQTEILHPEGTAAGSDSDTDKTPPPRPDTASDGFGGKRGG